MTPPPARLVRLHLDSRQTRRTVPLLIATAAVLRCSQPITKDAGLFPEVCLLLITVAAAAIIAAATHNPFGEPELTASSPLPALRLTHLGILTAAATAALAIAASTAAYDASTGTILRNLIGLTGIALLTAAVIGPHLAWTIPLGYVMYCGGQLDVQTSNLWTWPTQPASNQTATAIAAGLLIAGVTAVAFTGTRRDHASTS
jgi:hypothetical protein